MKTACVIGNSHIGAIKSGWEQLGDEARPFELEFFGSKSQSLSRTFVEDGVLKTDDQQVQRSLKRTGGSAEIDLARYDLFVIVGAGVHFKQLGRMMREATIHPHAEPGRRLVSRPAAAEAFRQRLQQLAAWDLASAISDARDAPVYLIPEPFFARDVIEAGDKPFITELYEAGLGQAFSEIFDTACERAFAPFGGFVAQPDETRREHMFTTERYSLEPVSLQRMMDMDLEARDDDYVHKNADYGEVMMRSLLELATA